MIVLSEGLPLVLEVFWKSTAALGAALFINVILRKKSADARRLVLSTVIAALFAAALAWPVLPRWTAATPAWLQFGSPAVPIAYGPSAPTGLSDAAGIAIPATRVLLPESNSPSGLWPALLSRTPALIPLVWFVATALFLVRFTTRLRGLRRLRNASNAVTNADLLASLEAARIQLGEACGSRRRITLLQNDAVSAPVTWGVLRPVILVPARFEKLPAECRDAVLCHELAHIEGHDFLFRSLAEIARALIWFQPLMWIALRQLREEQELACDNRVLAAGGKPSAYAKLLLDWDVRPGMVALIAVGMAHRSCLRRRLYALLDRDLRRDRVAGAGVVATWVLGLATALPLAALSLTPAVRVESAAPSGTSDMVSGQLPLVASVPQPAIQPVQTTTRRQTRVQMSQVLPTPAPVPVPVQTPAPQSAGTSVRAVLSPLPTFVGRTWLVQVDATVLDQNGKVVEGLSANDFALTEDGKPQAIGVFEFQKVQQLYQAPAPGGLNLSITSYYVLGYYTTNGKADGAYRKIGIVLKGNSTARLDFRAGYYAEKGFSDYIDAKVGAHFTVDGVTDIDTGSKTTPPAVILKVDPEYSEQARKAKYSGDVGLLAEVGASGQVTSVTVLNSLGMGLDEKAVEALTKWKFRPGTKDGNPVATPVRVDVTFRLL